MRVLVTGGAGYIGSHFVRLLADEQIESVVLDNLSAGHRDAVPPNVPLVCADVGDRGAVRALLGEYQPTAVVHFAGLIQVGESVRAPDLYYGVNLVQTLAMLEELTRGGVQLMVMSSTAAVYGVPQTVPIPEDHPRNPINAYGATKLAVERALQDWERAYGLRHAALRYFNAAGAHPSGTLAERHDPETHLIPLAIDAAIGRRGALTIFGEDWPTEDGTCVRDYIHVQDLATAHLQALRRLEQGAPSMTLNLGTGRGISVREIVDSVQRVSGRQVPVQQGTRRQGDPPRLVACASLAAEALGWKPQRSEVDQMIEDALRSRLARE
ncbi:MAG: UDP-glucose 4-epimerase GalE [Deltaproteobacteria bacterium]|nr:UDP-glucose 4-epimerase GalE [Deltaproteobacteria bacterium]